MRSTSELSTFCLLIFSLVELEVPSSESLVTDTVLADTLIPLDEDGDDPLLIAGLEIMFAMRLFENCANSLRKADYNDEKDDDQTFLAAWTHLLVVASPADTNSGMDRPTLSSHL